MKIDRIATRILLVVGTAVALTNGSLALSASSTTAAVSRTADVLSLERAANGKLLAIGRLDRVSLSEFAVSVLGQEFALIAGKTNFKFVEQAEVGRAVALFGEHVNNRYLVDAALVLDGTYVQGASKVYLRGPVTALNRNIGAISMGALELDASAFVYEMGAERLRAGNVAAVVGTQPSISGRVLVEGFSSVRATSPIYVDASLGTGRPDASVGTGRPDASVGTGRTTEASVGTGRPEASVGTGRPDASVGTGKPQASVGTGRPEASVGTGRPEASVGTGRPDASVGTGRPDASVGTGRTTEASVGTGRPEASVGTGRPDASVGTG